MFAQPLKLSRRGLVASGVALSSLALARSSLGPIQPLLEPQQAAPKPHPLSASRPVDPSINPELMRKALAALDQHSAQVRSRDRIAIADFTAPSSEPRFHFLDVESGKAKRLLVAHGMGSDPGHTGFLHSFSNRDGSNASSEGAFLTTDYYVGKHGRSQRLVGLDPTNSNALERAIVVHGAWYANEDMIAAHGKLGRSQGCFAVGQNQLDDVFEFLGKGRMIYAARA